MTTQTLDQPLAFALPQDGDAQRYLGPAEVTQVVGSDVTVLLTDGRETHAHLALAFPFQPTVEDELLVIGEADAWYVIGVLRSAGTAIRPRSGWPARSWPRPSPPWRLAAVCAASPRVVSAPSSPLYRSRVCRLAMDFVRWPVDTRRRRQRYGLWFGIEIQRR